jgi:hypothetical protein
MAFRNWSSSMSTLPPGQYENGSVTIAHSTSPIAAFISRPGIRHDRPLEKRSKSTSPIADAAAIQAGRSVFNVGK